MKRVRGIIIKDGKLVLIKRVKFDDTYYVIPGGGVERGENNVQALIRECQEELGVDVKVRKLVSKSKFNGQWEFFYFCLMVGGKLGKGNGPEYGCNSGYEGSHAIELVDFANLYKKNLKPTEIKNELLKLWSEIIKLSNTSRFGKIKINKNPLFLKTLSRKDAEKELCGYEAISEFYPVPVFLFSLNVGRNTVSLYEYENTIGKDKGLLVDYFAVNRKLGKKYYEIIGLYKKIFLKTLHRDSGKCADVFFSDRIETRIKKFYPQKFVKIYQGKKIKINGNEVVLNLKKILQDLCGYFKDRKNTWTVISQCDPNDLNIGIKPVFFDYFGGGRVPLTAEFATFFWYNLVQGSYLSPIYNRESFKEHEGILSKLDEVAVIGQEINHKVSPIRQKAILLYIERVVRPVMQKIPNFDFFNSEFRNYLAMKILAVFDVSKMKQKDRLLCLAYLQFFYDQSFSNIDDFTDHLKKVWPKK